MRCAQATRQAYRPKPTVCYIVAVPKSKISRGKSHVRRGSSSGDRPPIVYLSRNKGRRSGPGPEKRGFFPDVTAGSCHNTNGFRPELRPARWPWLGNFELPLQAETGRIYGCNAPSQNPIQSTVEGQDFQVMAPANSSKLSGDSPPQYKAHLR